MEAVCFSRTLTYLQETFLIFNGFVLILFCILAMRYHVICNSSFIWHGIVKLIHKLICSKQIGYGPAIGCMCLVNLVGRYQDFGRTCCCQLLARKALFFAEGLGSVFHENDGTSLPSNMACKLGAYHHVNLQLHYTYALITTVTW
jgi:hypothetical protein